MEKEAETVIEILHNGRELGVVDRGIVYLDEIICDEIPAFWYSKLNLEKAA